MKGQKLKLHQPMEFVVSDWMGKRTVVGSIYYVCGDGRLQYHIINISGQKETINQQSIVSIIKCRLFKQAEMQLICLSKLCERQMVEEKKYIKLQQELEKGIAYSQSRLNAATRRRVFRVESTPINMHKIVV